jgi:acetyl-CoA C-acetyltransferase/acetyl-CoA acyltransferase
MSKRIAILDGLRTPFSKAGGPLKSLAADDLAVGVVKELLARNHIEADQVDEVIFGNVAQPAQSANVARVIALKAGLPTDTIAHTVHRNCASGMQSITDGAMQIQSGQAAIVVAGGTESMSQIPLLFGAKMTQLLVGLMRARTMRQRIGTVAAFRPSHLRPVIALQLGLTDPVCGLNMGQTAEVLAREFGITREEQDAFALHSHRKAIEARAAGRLGEEILPIIIPPRYDAVQIEDDGIDEALTAERLSTRRPYFDRAAGTVTARNSCPITDGAAGVVLTTEQTAKRMGIEPLGYLAGWSYAALEGSRMGLGPVYATAKLLKQTGRRLQDFSVIELNEAFAAQVIANERAFASTRFAQQHLDQDHAVGEIDPTRLNVNGGAIALGHPVGATGTRLILTVLRELKRRNQHLGLATLCVGGGQGAAFALEAA